MNEEPGINQEEFTSILKDFLFCWTGTDRSRILSLEVEQYLVVAFDDVTQRPICKVFKRYIPYVDDFIRNELRVNHRYYNRSQHY
jgi:hypothetical protein